MFNSVVYAVSMIGKAHKVRVHDEWNRAMCTNCVVPFGFNSNAFGRFCEKGGYSNVFKIKYYDCKVKGPRGIYHL